MVAVKRAVKRAIQAPVAVLAPHVWRMRGRGSLLVLMYHRVLPPGAIERRVEQPGMYVSPASLDMQLTELRRHFTLVHLDDWLRNAANGDSLPDLACAITFDDGWRDNYTHAFPILRRHEAPASIFLVADYIGTQQQFWPNRLALLAVASWEREGAVRFPDELASLVEEARGDIDALIQEAKVLPEAKINELLERTETRDAGLRPEREVLDEHEIRAMAASGLVRFGSHTCSHYRLRGDIPEDILQREIVQSRERIRACSGQEVALFCYPNGDKNEAAVDLVRRNYLGAVTTRRGWHRGSLDPHLIQRVGIHEGVADRRSALRARVSGI